MKFLMPVREDFTLAQGKVFAVKKRQELFIYLNRCPHLGIPLEWEAS